MFKAQSFEISASILVFRVLCTYPCNLLVHIVGEFIVTAECDKCSEAEAVREEDLRHCIDPHLGLSQLGQVGCDVELDALHGSGKCDAADQKNCEENVGEECGEVNNLEMTLEALSALKHAFTDLSSPSHALPDAEVAQNPHEQKRPSELPTNVSDFLDAARDHQSATPTGK